MQPVSYGSQKAAFSSTRLSQSIWANCDRQDMERNGSGIFFFDDFLGGVAATTAGGIPIGKHFSILCEGDTVISYKASELGGYLDIETDGDDNDSAIIFTEPFCKLVPKSGNRVWLEARLEVGDADADQGVLFGLAEEAAQTFDIIDNDCAGPMDETMLVYIVTKTNADLSLADAKIHLIAQKDTAAAGKAIAEDVTNLDIIDTVVGSGSKATLADNTEVKLGMYFDGETTVHFFANGVEIATDELDTTYYDATKALCCVASIKTGAAATPSIAIDWIAGAYEINT